MGIKKGSTVGAGNVNSGDGTKGDASSVLACQHEGVLSQASSVGNVNRGKMFNGYRLPLIPGL